MPQTCTWKPCGGTRWVDSLCFPRFDIRNFVTKVPCPGHWDQDPGRQSILRWRHSEHSFGQTATATCRPRGALPRGAAAWAQARVCECSTLKPFLSFLYPFGSLSQPFVCKLRTVLQVSGLGLCLHRFCQATALRSVLCHS